MAEKPEDQFNSLEKIAKAKELFSRGTRNYYVKSYSEAADDLSETAKLFGEEYGVDGDELGEVYLLYAKSLIAVGQEENKLIDVPEEDDDEEDEPAEEEDNGEGKLCNAFNKLITNDPVLKIDDKPETNGTAEMTNGHSEAPIDDPQPGTSTANDNESSNDVQETDNDDADDGGNLELAWEVLLNAAAIFERQEQNGLSNLLEVYTEMAGISLENGNFEASMKDFNRALDVFSDLEEVDQNQRIAAELHYKIGLCQSMEKQYDESVKSFQAAANLLAEVVTTEKAREDQNEDVIATINDLEELQKEILNKITEIGETKAEEMEQVKREMLKMFGPAAGSSDGAGSSSSSSTPAVAAASSSSKSPEEANKPKPTDISHLIKRKKPDTESAVEESPAKKKAVETSPGEKVAVAVAVEKKAEEVETVHVIDNKT